MKWRSRIRVQEKGLRDLVTEADLASQRAIRNVIQASFPEHDFLGEEELEEPQLALEQARESEYCWVVDPLDGTTNYVHQLPMFASSVALMHCGRPIVGVVFDPMSNDSFRAVSGCGALHNGRPMRTTDVGSLSDALVAASFSAGVCFGSPEIERFVQMLLQCQGVRRMGSAALNMCYLAAGRLDGYWAASVSAWDVAAGVLMLQEAGGVISALDGQPFDVWNPNLVAAANPTLHESMIDVLSRIH